MLSGTERKPNGVSIINDSTWLASPIDCQNNAHLLTKKIMTYYHPMVLKLESPEVWRRFEIETSQVRVNINVCIFDTITESVEEYQALGGNKKYLLYAYLDKFQEQLEETLYDALRNESISKLISSIIDQLNKQTSYEITEVWVDKLIEDIKSSRSPSKKTVKTIVKSPFKEQMRVLYRFGLYSYEKEKLIKLLRP